MKFASILFSAVLALAVAATPGCAFIDSHKPQITGTLEIVGERAFSIGASVLMNSLTNSTGNYNHSVAEGLRSEIPNIVTSADVARIVKLWGPPSSVTGTAALKLAAVYSAAAPANQKQVAAVVEKMAVGLQEAASTANP